MLILGLSWGYHDASACLLKDGIIVAAAQEERFTRKKHDTSFPINAINYCLKSQDITIEDISYISYYEKPFLKFERVLSQHLEMFPKSLKVFLSSTPSWINEKLRITRAVKKRLKYKGDILFIEHHMAHAASSFFISPFEKAAIVTIDGVGEWTTTTYGIGERNDIHLMKEIKFPNSLGLLYSAITAYLGFSVNNSEYKVMGLSPYGLRDKEKNPYYDKLRKVVDIKKDGSYRFDMSYFVYHYADRMPSKKLCRLLGGPVRKPESELTQRHKDVSAALQMVYEEALFRVLNHVREETKCENLILAGGCGLNSVANGKILRNTSFKKVWAQPDPGDGGTSIGAASYAYYGILRNKRNFVLKDAYLGPEFSKEEVKDFLDKNKIKYSEFKDDDELIGMTAKLIHENNVIGWFQGRMEWGPRALGSRSILSNACNPKMQEVLNLKVKHRECYDNKTEILTKEGWKLFKDLKGNEEVATLNPQTKELEYQQIKKKVEYEYSGKMIHFKNKRIDLMVTPNHKVWVKKITNHQKGHSSNKKFEFEDAINLLEKENVQIKAADGWKGKEEKYFRLPKIKKSKYDPRSQKDKMPMDLWLEFLGYYLSEGSFCYNGGHYGTYVAQAKESKHHQKIEKCLNKLYKWGYNSGSFRLCNKQLYEYLKQFGKAKDKFIPKDLLDLSKRQLKILFDALMCGDGTHRFKQFKYTTTSKKLADNIQELGLKLGYSIITSKERLSNPKHNDIYYVRLNRGSKISWVRKDQSSLRSYNGRVYCVSVPKYHLLCVKREEKIIFSGNSFRPFAPVVCEDDALRYFDCDDPIPEPTDFMLMVYPVRKQWYEKIPSVTHVDGSGRLQTVRKEQNPLYYKLIKRFGELSGIPILINTSFNIRGEPIVCTPYDGYKCMMGTGIDFLVMDRFLIKREDNPQDKWDSEKYAKD
tara:strand:+ start:1139 stop:3919 length:2781 start_codon:yes stop_codon:yes gene_type:complete